MLAFLTNKMVVTMLATLILSALAAFHVIVPTTVNADSMAATILLIGSVATAILRFGHTGDAPADAKAWYLSKTIWASVIAAVFAVLALLGVVPPVTQSAAVEFVGLVLTVAAAIFGGTAKASIA